MYKKISLIAAFISTQLFGSVFSPIDNLDNTPTTPKEDEQLPPIDENHFTPVLERTKSITEPGAPVLKRDPVVLSIEQIKHLKRSWQELTTALETSSNKTYTSDIFENETKKIKLNETETNSDDLFQIHPQGSKDLTLSVSSDSSTPVLASSDDEASYTEPIPQASSRIKVNNVNNTSNCSSATPEIVYEEK